MLQIYKCIDRVIIWLGSKYEDRDLALAFDSSLLGCSEACATPIVSKNLGASRACGGEDFASKVLDEQNLMGHLQAFGPAHGSK
jgi:hypothetical protein